MSGERIALVEDSEVVRRFASRLLRHKGFEVSEYPDGQAALDVLLGEPPDLVVSDIQMPRVDGLELTRKLRDRFDKRTLPIVLVSVLSDEEDIVAGFEAGANDYLIKPYRTAELLAKIAVLLRERTYLRQESEPELPVMEGSGSSAFERASVGLDEDETQVRPVDGLLQPQSAQYFFDQYRVTGEYGRGGMGTVYMASRRSDDAPVALKVLAPRLSGNRTAIARFLRECRLLASLNTQNVVRVLDHGYDSGRYFLVMEAVDGESLDPIVLRDGPLPQLAAADVYAQVGRALQELTDHDLIHRDVKPANIIRGKDGVVKVVDFGLAKHTNEATTLTDTGYALGTSYYVAPEVIEGGKADARSDLFATGVSMYESLTGRRPFSGVVPYQIFKRIVAGDLPHPTEFRKDLRPGLVAILLKLLANDRGERYATGEELEHDLREWLAGPEADELRAEGEEDGPGPGRSLLDSSADTPPP